MSQAIFSQMAQDVTNTLGLSATFTPLVGDPVDDCQVDLDLEIGSQPMGESQVWEQGSRIEYRLSEVGKEAAPGDKFLIGSTTYTVKAVDENDGLFVRVVVK